MIVNHSRAPASPGIFKSNPSFKYLLVAQEAGHVLSSFAIVRREGRARAIAHALTQDHGVLQPAVHAFTCWRQHRMRLVPQQHEPFADVSLAALHHGAAEGATREVLPQLRIIKERLHERLPTT